MCHIDYIEFEVSDIALAKSFYRHLFGWDFVDYAEDYVAFNEGHRPNGGFVRVSEPATNGALVVLYTDDLEAKFADVQAAEAKINRKIFAFPGGRRFEFLDPFGNRLAVWSDK